MNPDFAARCGRFRQLLAEANLTMNLTRIESERDFEIKHVADSLAVVDWFPFLRTEHLKVADVGCGAGFPAVILALAFPNLDITAIDSTGKKVAFVAGVAGELGIPNLHAVQGRSCELARRPEWQERFKVVTARAVGAAPKIYSEAAKLLAPGGRFILYKTPLQAAQELPELLRTAPRRNWKQTDSFELPEASGTRCFLYF